VFPDEVSCFVSKGKNWKLLGKRRKQRGNGMETKSFKALSIARLQGNQQGNLVETGHESDGNFEEKIDPKSFPHYCPNQDCWCSSRLSLPHTTACLNC
jgi:3-dehydroquinate dehydratase